MDCARGACRSCRRVRARDRGADRGRRKWCATTPSAPYSAWRRAGCAAGPRWEPAAHPARRQAEYGDRKSTRLNSSHDQISYAVFCLKKKISDTTFRLTRVKRVYGDLSIVFPTDMTYQASDDRLAAQIAEAFGRINVLDNIARIARQL